MDAIVIDTETTDASDEARPVQIAWRAVQFNERVLRDVDGMLTFNERFNPERTIRYAASAIHGIGNDDVVGCRSWTEFALPEGCQYIIGHNVDFDWRVLGSPDVRRICTLALAREYWPDDDHGHTLGACMWRLIGPNARTVLSRAHDAETDVGMTLRLAAFLARANHCTSFDDLWQASERARVPVTMPYGKHRGERIADVPSDYKAWLLRQPDVDPYLRKALTKERASA